MNHIVKGLSGLYTHALGKRNGNLAGFRLLFLAAAVAASQACGGGSGDGSTSTPTAPLDPITLASGSYALLRVNGSTLPAEMQYTTPSPGGRIDINSGTMVLRKDLTFTETFNFTNTPSGGTPTNDSDVTAGTFTLDNGTLTFSTPDPPNPNHTWTGTLDATGTISYNDQGFVAVYKK